jgi:hypothetical protein
VARSMREAPHAPHVSTRTLHEAPMGRSPPSRDHPFLCSPCCFQTMLQRMRAAQEAMESEAKEEEFYLKAKVAKVRHAWPMRMAEGHAHMHANTRSRPTSSSPCSPLLALTLLLESFRPDPHPPTTTPSPNPRLSAGWRRAAPPPLTSSPRTSTWPRSLTLTPRTPGSTSTACCWRRCRRPTRTSGSTRYV